MIRRSRSFVLVAVLAASGLAFAGGDKKAQKAAAPNDAEIAHIAVTANQIDVDAGKAAVEKSQNAQVKEFAQRMIDDHTQVIDQASALVKKLNVTPKDNDTSKTLKANADKTREELGTKSGAEFDRGYVDNEVAYHTAVIATVDNVLIPNTQNAELKSLLESVRPVLQSHLDHAKELQQQLSGARGVGGAGEEGSMDHQGGME